ncbi:hypothetical protein RhiirA5_434133 [Rhizophagus irregularis]|uniref:Uncharacterized protein n=1 Tax=Rhizophagus irregularis TaxID=588596 RepID=A0A2I1EUM6_9GLOM|nr:hypothetical protein RhiirA5_434133 [Rhizophagus irregularis]PKC61066.1 hypothetical protein RhiirA1_467088 [Rhizophagus irregularis]PKY25844.1 hypothetical protein RhiirB3_440951 [Rhizophagus irregularis]CAB4479737.1 unnamed protein product [Rhizophagus irregularis]CAB5308459.1 unnamed protein product [Rhizophagus irregularis]
MKKLILILVLAIVTFIAFTSATPTSWKRGTAFRAVTVPKGKPSLVSRQASQCGGDPTYFLCENGIGCCPISSTCISPNHCSIECGPDDNYCADGSTCCLQNQACVLVEGLYGCTEGY